MWEKVDAKSEYHHIQEVARGQGIPPPAHTPPQQFHTVHIHSLHSLPYLRFRD